MAAQTLSAVMLMPRQQRELAEALRHLRAQTRPEAIEVILVHIAAHAADVDLHLFAPFRRVVPVAVAGLPTVASGFVAALAHATGDVVALVEDHVLLDPGWAEAVLAAHSQPTAAVAPRMLNANPGTATSWANFLASFSEAAVARPAGHVESGPGHNTSYKRGVLEHYRDELPALYQSERTFHYRLRREGHTIVHEPRAQLAHLNISVPTEALRHALLGGALFGSYRARDMGWLEKMARTVFAPLVPPVRLWRTLAMSRGQWRLVPLSGWALLPLLLLCHAAGEALGYWGLVGDVEARYEHFELHRLECLRSDEHPLMTGVIATPR